MDNKQIVLYGIAGVRDGYRVIRYHRIDLPYATVSYQKWVARCMKEEFQTIERVFVVDNRYGLSGECKRAMHGTIEDAILFKDMLEREGNEIKL